MVAANNSNKIGVVDAKEGKLQAVADVGRSLTPAVGANFVHPKFGPVWSTGHLGDETISLIGTDPKKHAQYAFKEWSRQAQGPRRRCAVHQEPPEVAALVLGCSLNPDPKISQSVVVYDIKNLDKGYTVLPIAEWAGLPARRRCQARGAARSSTRRATKCGLPCWSAKDKQSALVVVDDKTLKLKAVIKDPRLITPTGHFNINNTQHDVY